MKNPFWLVWGEQRGLPHKKHGSYEAAESEAQRLAQQHPGYVFNILESKADATVKSVVITKHWILF